MIGLPGDARVELAPGTSARVFGSPQHLRMPEGYAVSTWSVAVQSGRVTAIVDQPRKTAVLLTASQRFSAVVAKGTGILIVDDGEYSAANLNGIAHTITQGHWAKLAKDKVRVLTRDTKHLSTESLLDAVEMLPHKSLWVTTNGRIKVDTFEWKPLKAASHYEVSVSRPQESKPISSLTTVKPRISQPLGPLGPGLYELTVRAVDQRGLPGVAKPVQLRVLGVDLPGGAYVSPNGIIHLGAGQHARFTHAEGLELTYSGAARYLPGTSEVPLTNGKPTLVSIRQPNSSEVELARIQPRNISAEVEMGPVTARWPTDRVEIAVRLRTNSNAAIPNFIEAHPKVSIGIDPVELQWRQDGETLRANVPPSHRKGPWVIRVEVEDQFGLPLGRGMLEVVPAQSKGTPPRNKEPRERISRADPTPSR